MTDTPWSIDDCLPEHEFCECWDGAMVVRGFTRNQARHEYAYGYGERYIDVKARRVWIGPWTVGGSHRCEDCTAPGEYDDGPCARCTAFCALSREQPGFTPAWEISVR